MSTAAADIGISHGNPNPHLAAEEPAYGRALRVRVHRAHSRLMPSFFLDSTRTHCYPEPRRERTAARCCKVCGVCQDERQT